MFSVDTQYQILSKHIQVKASICGHTGFICKGHQSGNGLHTEMQQGMSVKEHMQLNVVKMRKWATIMHVHSSRIGKSDVLVASVMKI
jgi:hypothetical protein